MVKKSRNHRDAGIGMLVVAGSLAAIGLLSVLIGEDVLYADKIYRANVGESEKTLETNFFTKNDKFKCWLTHAGSDENLYLSIYPMWKSDKSERDRIVHKAINRYKPVCNMEDT